MRFRPLAEIDPTRSMIVIPAFSIFAGNWLGYAIELAEGQLNNASPFSFQMPITPVPSFGFAVRWAVGVQTFRLKLWPSAGLYYPIYNGERIGIGAVLEVWQDDGYTTAVNPSDIILPTTIMNQPVICPMCQNANITQTVPIYS